MRTPTTLLQDAWAQFKAHYQLFFSIYAVPAVLSIVFVLMFGEKPNLETIQASQVGLFFTFMAILFVVNVFMGIAMIRAISAPHETTFQSAYGYAKVMFWPYLWVGILTGAAVMIGFVLLIVPGIIFMIWFLFGYLALLIDGKRGTEALKASKSYVTGRWWAVFGRFLFMLLVLILISAAFGIVAAALGGVAGDRVASVVTLLANFVVVPLSLSYIYFMYQDVKAATEGMRADVPPEISNIQTQPVAVPAPETESNETPEPTTPPEEENTTKGYGQ